MGRVIFLTKHTNLTLASTLMRHDKLNLDINISSFNNEIEETVRTNGISQLPLHSIAWHHYTQHGLHLNKRGKDYIAALVANMISSNETSNTSAPTFSMKLDKGECYKNILV